MNQYDVEDMHEALCDREDRPNLRAGAKTLYRLMRWTNSHSDGWAYWQAPRKASQRLQDALTEKVRLNVHGVAVSVQEDFTDAELKRLLSPIKGLLTKRGIEHDEVIWLPERDSRRRTAAVITIRLDLPYDASMLTEQQYRRLKAGLANLAEVMGVQAEDGVYSDGGGRKDGGEFVSDIKQLHTDVHLTTYEITREEARKALDTASR